MNAAQNSGAMSSDYNGENVATNHAEEKEAKEQAKKDKKNLARAEKMERHVNLLPASSEKADSVVALLKILLPFLRCVLEENV